MKWITGILKPNESEPIATSLLVTFSDGANEAEQTFFAKATLSQIKHGLRAVNCTDVEVNNYAPKIKQMLNQWNELADFPTIAIA